MWFDLIWHRHVTSQSHDHVTVVNKTHTAIIIIIIIIIMVMIVMMMNIFDVQFSWLFGDED